MGKRGSVYRDAWSIVEASSMMSRNYRFFIVLALLHVVGLTLAILDRSEATTKPPKRREPVLPWYPRGKDYIDSSEDVERSPKWQTDPDNPTPRKPIIVNSGTKTWSPWRKSPGSEIEQRTEISVDHRGETALDQDHESPLEYDQFEQREKNRFPPTPSGSKDQEQATDPIWSKGKIKNDPVSLNPVSGNGRKPEVEKDQDVYEGVPVDSTKPHKEKILLSSKPKASVARYDSGIGVQCPDAESTGQFVYPPDCKFFVNCWQGRAFVQPCAPGTLFNPDTLECDFPHKVKCYGGELADFPSTDDLDSAGRHEPLLSASHSSLQQEHSQVPKCPPHVTGMIAHPSECTKFLQCANGGTFIMDCGPGTVFNPAISVCDWPRNVRGCEDALKSNEDGGSPLVPPNSHGPYDLKNSEYNQRPNVKKVQCPSGYSGLLPHPDTCKKFLQCDHGNTWIMDCGPGTAFNPLTTVCDWPYNVPGCNEDKPAYTQFPTTARPWSSVNPTNSRPWENSQRYNQTSPGRHKPWPAGQVNPPVTTTNPPKTNWEALRPTWRPTWRPDAWATTQSPYDRGQQGHTGYNHRDRYENTESNRYKDHGGWQATGNSQNYPTSGRGPDHSGGHWSSDHHHHQHHDHYSPYPPEPHGNKDTQQPGPPYDQRPVPRPNENGNQGSPHGNWHTDHGYHHEHHEHHSGAHDRQWNYPAPLDYPDEADLFHQQVAPSPDSQTQEGQRYNPDGTSDSNRNGIVFPENNSSPNRRVGQEFTPNRRQHGRIGPGFNFPGIDRESAPDGNIYVDNDYELSESGRPVRNRTTWSQPVVPGGRGFQPSTWTGQQGQGQSPAQPPNRQWNQGTINVDDQSRKWDSRTNVYQQSTIGRQANPKIDRWTSKGLTSPGGITQDSTKPLYPSGVYVNINGTRGHFITKEIEVNQGHSNTKTYRPNDHRGTDNLSKTDGNAYIGPQRINNNSFNRADTGCSFQQPATDLQPPYHHPVNRPFGPAINCTEASNVFPYSPGVRSPKSHSPSSSSADLLGSESIDYHRASAPSTNLQPPHQQSADRSWVFPNSGEDGHYYPPVPATDLYPPDYEPPNRSLDPPSFSSSNVDVQYPRHPPISFHPTYYQPPSRSLDPPNYSPPKVEVQYPATDLQPPYYQHENSSWNIPNNTNSRNVDNQYPATPSSDLKPPFYQSVNDSADSPPFVLLPRSDSDDSITITRTTTQRTPDKHLILPIKKTVLQTAQKGTKNVVVTTDPNTPSVSIEYDDSSTKKFDDVVEPDLDYDVDVLDEKEVWKPVLVFENKTKTTTESSVIMKINKKTVDVDLFNIEDAPFRQEEPPFPVYYIPPVEPLSHSRKSMLLTPISGQVIRLRGGSGPHDGYVEVQGTNPGWGIVCDHRNSWTLKEAHVVCRQLGFARGAEMAWQGRNNRNGVPSWIAANSVTCNGSESRFQSCKFTHDQECRVERDAIGVRCTPNRVAHCRDDETPYEGQCYHLADPDSGLNHAEALEYCAHRQSGLIDITTQSENDFISEWLTQLHPEVGSIMTSGVGFTTLNHTLWLWEDASRAKFRFNKWWPGWMADKKQPPFVGARPLCIVMKRKFPCHERPESVCVADYFFWDTEDCATTTKGHSYICKRPYDDIGCIYGKGNQYAGNANVTASGKKCIHWADERVAHPLIVNVVNREVRDKLKTHNYCRNPNPNKESRPWCFTGPGTEREYCDIPPCGNMVSKRSHYTGQCKPKHFECLPGECIPAPWVCDGEEDCTNGADERSCTSHLGLFQKHARQKLEGYDVEKWLNTPLKTCALRCKEADFTCRSFAHKAVGNICLLSDSNVGMTGSLKTDKEFDYYEMKERRLNCDGMYVCGNRKCVNQTQVCNGKNDCNDRTDESICTVETLDYAIRLAGSNSSSEGRIEVKILGVWGQVCDDGFGMIDADVICKELGFNLGALEIRPGGFYGNLDPPTRFMVDQLKCRGNETSLRECDFDGWGVHNCQPEEAVGVVCKTAVDSCQEGYWKCDTSPTCIQTLFICDEVEDCPDRSDESPEHCDAPFEIRLANGSSPLEGRVEVRHHGVWGTVCDDDFSNAAAAVICRSLGYGGNAIVKKDGYFGAGEGPIWLDEVFCYGNETQLSRCQHNHWGQHNCDHNEDAGVICTPGDVNDPKLLWETVPDLPEPNVNDLLPTDCGKRFKDFNEDEDLIFEKVVHASIAPKGTYPWQASIRVRGHSRSSHWCGAVVLSPLHVLTAAHCLEGYNKGTYFVRAGDYNTEIDEGSEAEANIEDYYIHEDFRKGHRMNNDIALVLLKGRGIPLGKDIMPICLPHENIEYPAGLNCTISGFGSIETGKSTHSKDLRYGWVPLLDQSVCRAGHIYGEGAISDGMVCAGYLDEGVDTCDGDSGGPLACYHNGAFTLYGITSWGQHCGKANKPGVYVRVSHYRRWIDKKLRESLMGR